MFASWIARRIHQKGHSTFTRSSQQRHVRKVTRGAADHRGTAPLRVMAREASGGEKMEPDPNGSAESRAKDRVAGRGVPGLGIAGRWERSERPARSGTPRRASPSRSIRGAGKRVIGPWIRWPWSMARSWSMSRCESRRNRQAVRRRGATGVGTLGWGSEGCGGCAAVSLPGAGDSSRSRCAPARACLAGRTCGRAAPPSSGGSLWRGPVRWCMLPAR